MRRSFNCLRLLLALVTGATFVAARQAAPPPNLSWRSALHAVVESERAFARSANDGGTRAAFLAFIAEDAVLFRPQPVPGKKYLLDHPATPGKLSWFPIFADVSASCDLGYTTGPYEFRKTASDAVPSAWGNYFTIWKKQPDGAWKFVVDFGTSNPDPQKAVPEFNPEQAQALVMPAATMPAESATAELLVLERKLSSLSAIEGASALKAFVATDARFFRPNRQPAVGIAQVRSLLSSGPGAWIWKPIKAVASGSGDLGFVYGSCEFHTQAAGSASTRLGYYLRVYKRQSNGGWKIVAEVASF